LERPQAKPPVPVDSPSTPTSPRTLPSIAGAPICSPTP
jgi:hypothetical protein